MTTSSKFKEEPSPSAETTAGPMNLVPTALDDPSRGCHPCQKNCTLARTSSKNQKYFRPPKHLVVLKSDHTLTA